MSSPFDRIPSGGPDHQTRGMNSAPSTPALHPETSDVTGLEFFEADSLDPARLADAYDRNGAVQIRGLLSPRRSPRSGTP